MTISVKFDRFKSMSLMTDDCAHIMATPAWDDGTAVVTLAESMASHEAAYDMPQEPVATYWYFSAKCCREAAEFFTRLAEELER